MTRFLLLLLLALPTLMFAGVTPPPLSPHLAPWMGNLWEFEFQGSYSYQHYHRVSTPNCSIRSPGNDHFFDLGLSLPFWPYYDLEVELLFAKTHTNSFSYEATRGTLRYGIYDAGQGDCFSLVWGGTITIPTGRFLDDPSVAFHGDVNGEVFLSFGKEFACIRTWIAGGVGVSNRGKFINNGWYFSRGAFEVSVCDLWEFGLFGDLLYAVGGDNFSVPFGGYAGVAHQSIDLGGYFKKRLCFWGYWGGNYAYRVHARNFPEEAHIVTLQIEIPFGL